MMKKMVIKPRKDTRDAKRSLVELIELTKVLFFAPCALECRGYPQPREPNLGPPDPKIQPQRQDETSLPQLRRAVARYPPKVPKKGILVALTPARPHASQRLLSGLLDPQCILKQARRPI